MNTATATIDAMTTMEARHVTRILPGPIPVTLVDDVSLRVRQGEFVSITGPSGSGKSSLLYLLGLLDVPTKGQVFINGQPTQGLTKSEISNVRLHDIGFVFQYHFLLAEFSVFENVALPMEKAGRYSTQEIRHRVMGLLNYLGIESEARKTPDRLSGGQRQRAAIARAIANNPTIILADEPTGNLDSKNSEAVCELFVRIAKDHGRSIIAVTHDLDFASRADRRIHLVDGAIESDTTQ